MSSLLKCHVARIVHCLHYHRIIDFANCCLFIDESSSLVFLLPRWNNREWQSWTLHPRRLTCLSCCIFCLFFLLCPSVVICQYFFCTRRVLLLFCRFRVWVFFLNLFQRTKRKILNKLLSVITEQLMKVELILCTIDPIASRKIRSTWIIEQLY